MPSFWVFKFLKRESSVPTNAGNIRHNIYNIQLQTSIYDI